MGIHFPRQSRAAGTSQRRCSDAQHIIIGHGMLFAAFAVRIQAMPNNTAGRPQNEKETQMAYSINADFCNGCGSCQDVCPNDAISEKGSSFVIDSRKCKECVVNFPLAQCAKVCPADACRPA